MSNQLLTNQVLTYETLMILQNNLQVVNGFTSYSEEFGKKGNKIGDTLSVRKPQRYIGRTGAMLSPEGLSDTQVPITIDQQYGVDFELSTSERYLSIDNVSERYLKPAGISIANKIDSNAALMAVQNTSQFVGSVGTVPGLGGSDSFLIYSQAGQLLIQNGFKQQQEYRIILTAAGQVGWNTYTKQFFNPGDSLTKQWKSGQVNNALGYQFFVDENLPTQTIGLLGGTPIVAGANQTGTTLLTSGWTALTAVLNVGDVITIPSVFTVNPQTRQSNGTPFSAVVQAPVTSDGGGLASIVIYPALVPSGQYQNVSASPADLSLISVFGVAAAGQSALSGVASRQGILYHPDAFGYASFPGEVPDGTNKAYTAKAPGLNGHSLRYVEVFDSVRDMWVSRFDWYGGFSPMYTEGAVRFPN